ncbi:hypothetical protein T231_13425 [Tannerella sp. oral taxon BU063 isolate Cell 6/7/9]|uniref:Uncharacterized protein n=2 Tax=Tannerella serpentiformis TaxID=712710 RepID=W2CU22_9BACT|nr:hypothetical protein T231_13425 [Tannerella sp. oral taxon BU063 isolate Cell 6/7/9]ETK10699.1 hypothetical protein T230_01870 [Tannerella sp. oral taxon BU063 isolate Cell 1/3]
MFRPHQSDELQIGQSLLVIYSPMRWRKMRQIRGAVSFTVFDTAATGIHLALHEHHICLKSSVNPLLGRAHGTSIILYLPLDIIMRGTR